MSARSDAPTTLHLDPRVRWLVLAGVTLVALLAIAASARAAAITPTSDANALSNAMVVGGGVTGATLNTDPLAPSPLPNATSDEPLADFPTEGSTYTIMTTGDPLFADDPNDEGNIGKNLGEPIDPPTRGDTAYDISTLAVPISVPTDKNCIALQYRFLSDEFPEYVDTQYNDAFIAELDVSNWTTSGSDIDAPRDFATNTGAAQVSVNGVGPIAVSPAESEGTTYDAATGLVTTKTQITPGNHTLYLSIFDQGDQIYDSAVFVDNVRTLTESPATCKPPEVAKTPAKPPAKPPQIPATISVGPSIEFKGSSKAVVTVNVPGPGTVTAEDASATARAGAVAKKKKKPLIKRSSVQATKAGPVEVTIRLAKAGKKALKKKGKVKVRTLISFTPAGAAASTANLTQTIKFKKKKNNKR